MQAEMGWDSGVFHEGIANLVFAGQQSFLVSRPFFGQCAYGRASGFRCIRAGCVFMHGNGGSLLNALDANCSSIKDCSFGMFSAVAGYGKRFGFGGGAVLVMLLVVVVSLIQGSIGLI